MADEQPVDPTLAAGMPEETQVPDSGDPKTLGLPPRWSGAAPVPSAGPRRSVWSRLRDRVSGTERPTGDDEWPAMPAVDPWADHDTLAWTEAHTAVPVARTEIPQARREGATRIEDPPTAKVQAAATAEADAATAASTKAAGGTAAAPSDRVAALNARLDAASAAADIVEKKAAEAAKAAAAATAAKAEAARAAVAKILAEKAEARAKSEAEAKAKAEEAAKPKLPHPGTYPPPAGGTGLPPLVARKAAPPKAGWTFPRRKPAPAATVSPVQPRPQAPLRQRPPEQPPWMQPPPRRRGRLRRALRRLTLLTVVSLVLCCGLPVAYTQIPGAQQFAVSAVLPDSFSDLSLRDTESARQAVDRLAEQVQDAGSSADAFAGVYADGNGKRVTLYGVTGFRLLPGSDVSAQLDRLTGELKLTDVTDYDTGQFGVHQKCGVGRLDGTAVVACSWADHGSIATVLLTRRSLEESAALVTQLRDEVLVPKF